MDTEFFVPGRLCLLGEHSDWAGGYRTDNPDIPVGKALVVGTQEGLYASARALDRPVLVLTSSTQDGSTLGPLELPLDPAVLLQEARKGGFWSYAAGTAYRMLIAHHVGGLEINNHRTTLPMSKGLSSSAAICVMVARAFNRVYNLKLTTRGEMEFAYQGEITTPSKCGRMDQACAFGAIPVLATFDGDVLHVETLKLRAPLYLVLVDLKAVPPKDTTTILAALQRAYPRPSSEAEKSLHALLGDLNHQFISRAIEALASGDVPGLGRVMCEAQAEFDARAAPLCPSQLTSPKLHACLAHPSLQPLIWGGKGIGSQGDGTAQLLAKGPGEQARICDLVEQELGMGVMPLTVEVLDQ